MDDKKHLSVLLIKDVEKLIVNVKYFVISCDSEVKTVVQDS